MGLVPVRGTPDPLRLTSKRRNPMSTESQDCQQCDLLEMSVDTMKQRIQQLEDELSRVTAERDEMEARAIGLLFRTPEDTTCGEIRRWRDEAKAKLAALAETRRKLEEVLALVRIVLPAVGHQMNHAHPDAGLIVKAEYELSKITKAEKGGAS